MNYASVHKSVKLKLMAKSACCLVTKSTRSIITIVGLSVFVALCAGLIIFGSYAIVNHWGLKQLNATVTGCSNDDCSVSGGQPTYTVDVSICYSDPIVGGETWCTQFSFNNIPCGATCTPGWTDVWWDAYSNDICPLHNVELGDTSYAYACTPSNTGYAWLVGLSVPGLIAGAIALMWVTITFCDHRRAPVPTVTDE